MRDIMHSVGEASLKAQSEAALRRSLVCLTETAGLLN